VFAFVFVGEFKAEEFLTAHRFVDHCFTCFSRAEHFGKAKNGTNFNNRKVVSNFINFVAYCIENIDQILIKSQLLRFRVEGRMAFI
jgi:hypothetical protein